MAGTSQRRQRPTTVWGRSYSAADLQKANKWLQRKGTAQKVASKKKKSSGSSGG